jgi:hypothetical protein
MTPKEKAYELVILYTDKHNNVRMDLAKKFALIAVNQIFEFMKMDDEYTETASNANSKWVYYWIDVKKEIEKL